jgi:hypothetical protein
VGRRLASLFPDAAVCDNVGVAPEETVVAGLADSAGLDQISLHRPGYDIVLDWADGRLPVYEAFTPLYEPWEVYSGHSDLGYERRLFDTPSTGVGQLRIVAVTGDPIEVALDGTLSPGIPVPFGSAGVVFRAFADGRISLTDGLGQESVLRCDAWPVLRGHRVLTLHRVAPVDR